MSDTVNITIRADSGDAVRAFRDVNGHLRDMRGRFVSEGSVMSRSMTQLGKSIGGVKGALIPLATAAVPIMAKMAVTAGGVAAKTAGAGVALGAFGAALAGQVGSLKEAGEAQKKYADAVAQSGRGSKQAAEAQRAVQAQLASMPQATARASVALGTLKGVFEDFSDDTAKFTMAPVEKSFTVLGQVIPKLTPMVQGASTQLDRLVTIAGGAVATPGFDALSERLSTFANRSLKEAVDGIVHFSRALSEGQASGPVAAFMEYAAKNGPAVQDTLANVGDALVTVAQGAADAGPGMLTLVNAAAGLVASFPPELITTLLQTAVALKAVSLAGAAAAGIGGIMTAARTQIAALGATSAAAGGGLAGLRAAFLALGTAAKASIVAGGILAVGLAVSKLSDLGQQAPPKMDQLTSSIRELGKTGKVTGEAARVFGADMSELAASFDKVSDNGVVEFFDELSTGFGLFGEGTNEEAKKMIDSFDESLANLVKSGNADLAKAALANFRKEAAASGYDLGDLDKRIDGYKGALADAKFEQDYAAESMGAFGRAAQDTSAKLSAQKTAADGLRASIFALNDVNRSAHDAQTQFERSLDGLTESFKEHGNTLSKDTEAGLANRDAMSSAAKAHDELIASGVAAGDSVASLSKESEGLRETMMRLATDAFDGNKQKAKEYVNELLGIPKDITTFIKAEKDDAVTGLEAVRTAIRDTPDSKEVQVSTLNGAAIAALEAVGLKTKQLPDGKTAVFTANGQSLGSIGSVSTALNNLNGKTAYTFTEHTVRYISEYQKKYLSGRSQHDITGATGGLFTGKAFRYAEGGPVVGPGTGTSDDVFAPWLSNGEFVMKAAAVDKYGEKFMQAINDGRLQMPGFAKGGKVNTAVRDARDDLRDQFDISHFGRRAGYQRTPFEKALGAPSDLKALVSALNGARGDIKKAFSGRTETRLLKQLDSAGKALIKYEKQLTTVNKSLEKAKDKLDSLKSSASQLSSSVKSGVLSAANITRGTSGDKAVTVRSIVGGLVESRDKATAFADALKELKARGLDKDLIKQIGEAGIEGGGLETAGALLRASGSEIASINDLQKEIGKAAGAAGKTTADAFYGAAIKAQEKLVKSLGKQQGKLERAMDRLAKSMEKALKRALGGKAAGGIIGAAAGGAHGGLTWVGEQGPELVRLPYGSMVHSNPDSRRIAGEGVAAWESMLTAPTGRRYGGAPAGGGQPIIVHQTITLDGRVVAKQIFDPLRGEVRKHGGLRSVFPSDFDRMR